jgi:hypothetical protein
MPGKRPMPGNRHGAVATGREWRMMGMMLELPTGEDGPTEAGRGRGMVDVMCVM